MTAVALPNAGFFEKSDLLGATVRTSDLPIRPAKLYHELLAVLEVLEVDHRFSECFYAFHALNIAYFLRYVKYINALTSKQSKAADEPF